MPLSPSNANRLGRAHARSSWALENSLQRVLWVVAAFSFVLGAGLAQGQAPAFVFATSAPATNDSIALSLAIDAGGNCLLAGYFTGTTTFGSTTITSAGETDIFVAKYDGTGRLLWVRQAGGTNYDEAFGIAVDQAGNCYVTGYFTSTASFGLTNLTTTTTNGGSDFFIARYDSDGNLIWVRQAGGEESSLGDFGAGIAVDTNGNCYVTGDYVGPATFGNVTLPNNGTVEWNNSFLAKYDGDGNLVWARSYGSGVGEAVAVDGVGNVYLTAEIGEPGNPYYGVYYLKLDNSGNYIWAGDAGTNSSPSSITVDSSGNMFLTGVFDGEMSLNFSGVTLWSRGHYDIFLAKYSPDGSLQWVKQIGGTNSNVWDSSGGVVTDSSGNCFLAGEFSGTAEFGLTNLVSVGANDAFVAKYDPSGNLLWVVQAGGGQDARPLGIAWTPGKGIYIAGGFIGQVKFGQTVLAPSNTTGGWNTFLARIDEMPILAVSNSAGGVVLSWPTNQLGFTLEKATNSSPAGGWSTVTNRVSVSGDHYVVTDQLSGSSSFYRLTKP